MATIVDVLRAGQGARRAGNRRQRWDQFSQDMAGQSPVVGTGGTPASVGGVNITIPGQQAVNWGAVLGGAASNFMGARAQRDEERLMEQKEMLSNELMRSTFENDPEGMRLIQAYQAGVPGAEQAVQAHLAPKKEALGAFLQYIQSGVADEDSAAAMAERYGISPEVGRKMASTAKSRTEQAGELEHARTLETEAMRAAMRGQKTTTPKFVPGTGLTDQELMAMPPEVRMAYMEKMKSMGRETTESKERGKLKVEAEQNLPKLQNSIKDVKSVIEMADKANWLPGNLGLGPKWYGSGSQEGVMLRQAINDLVLAATGGSLGAGVSNADVAFLKDAQVALDSGNRDTAVAQLNRVLSRLLQQEEQYIKLTGGSGGSGIGEQRSKFDFGSVRSRPGYEKNIPSFEDMMKEMGYE